MKILNSNLFEMDLGSATVVSMFLTQKSNARLKPRLLALKPGTRVVTHIWTFEGWAPVISDEKLKVYLYSVPSTASSSASLAT